MESYSKLKQSNAEAKHFAEQAVLQVFQNQLTGSQKDRLTDNEVQHV